MAKETVFICFTWNSSTLSEQFRQLGTRLREEGYEVFAMTQPGRQPREENHFSGVYQWKSKSGARLSDAFFLARLMRQHRPVCMISNFSTIYAALIVGWLTRVPVRIAWYHSLISQFEGAMPQLLHGFHIWRGRLVYRLATHLIAVSQATRKDAVDNYKLPLAKASVLYNGARAAVGCPLAEDAEPRRLVCVAGFEHYKGQDILIRAVGLLSREFPNLQVEFLGQGSQMKRCVDLADELGLARHFVFLGAVHPGEVAEHLRRAWAFVLPSRADSFPVAVLEAMACGVPVVATAVGGVPEAIEDGVTGFLVPPEDVEALADRLKRILSNRQLRDALGQAARKRFDERFELGIVARHQAKFISGLIRQTVCKG